MGLVANTIVFFHIYTHRKFLLMYVIWYSKFSNPCRTMCRTNNFRFANGKFHYVTRRMRRNVTNHDLVEEHPLPTNENFKFIYACSIVNHLFLIVEIFEELHIYGAGDFVFETSLLYVTSRVMNWTAIFQWRHSVDCPNHSVVAFWIFLVIDFSSFFLRLFSCKWLLSLLKEKEEEC